MACAVTIGAVLRGFEPCEVFIGAVLMVAVLCGGFDQMPLFSNGKMD